jgi:hypothetical protein
VKDITTLVPDIEQLYWDVIDGKTIHPSPDELEQFGKACAAALQKSLDGAPRNVEPNTLYMSQVGKPCHRQLWYERHPEEVEIKERMLPQTKVKFLYGDLIENLTLALARIAGHDVTHEQAPASVNIRSTNGNVWTLRGRLDALVDGSLVDVKSASGRGFLKFEEGLNDDNDAFGYREQLHGYYFAGPECNDTVGFLAVNKESGKMCFSQYEPGSNPGFTSRVKKLVDALESPTPPPRAFDLITDKSGNKKLGVNCSYCPFKYDCWKDANDGEGLRTFVYSNGPVFLGTVNTVPRVAEITDQIKQLHKRKETADV